MTTVGMAILGEINSVTSEARWDSVSCSGHSVHFYEDDSFLLEELSRFVAASLVAGDSAVVIATKQHREGLHERLVKGGLDVDAAVHQGRFLCLDAAETLSQFMSDGQPDAMRFDKVVGGAIARLAAASHGRNSRVAAFGEMVALLWAQ
jgi:hypothetical protein